MSENEVMRASGRFETRGGQSLSVLVALSICSAVLVFLAFPPADAGAVAWVALVPLMLALSQAYPLQGFLLGWLFGTVMMGSVSYFLGIFGALPLILAALLFGLYYGLFGLAVATVAPLGTVALRVGAIAAAWTLAEMARGYAGPLAYTFGHLAYTQHDMLPIIQFASILGAYGVGFLMALTSAGLATLLQAFMPPMLWYQPDHHRTRFLRISARVMLTVYGLVFLTYIWGALVIYGGERADEEGTELQAAAVQVDVAISTTRTVAGEQELTAVIDAYVDQTARLSEDVELVVWPETAIGLDLGSHLPSRLKVSALARKLDAYMLVGALEYEGDLLYNSAFLVSPEGEFVETYRKIDLVMFGEYVPMRGQWEFLERYPIRSKDFIAGTERTIMDVAGLQVGPLICFEAIFPGPGREVCRRGAEVIAVLNSDAWAEGTLELLHNSYTAPLRAVEARRYLVRAASTGISGIYDPYGAEVATVAPNVAGVVTAPVYTRQKLSTYHRWGDGPLLVACLLLLVGAWTAIRQHRRHGPPQP